jgi:transcriptional regulator with XRE-family HTH domain
MDGSQPVSSSRGVGSDLRALRKSRSVTLATLAADLDRSIGWLSQVERGLSEPSINDLRRIAGTFDIPVGFFFRNDNAPDHERDHVVRAANRRPLGDPVAGLTEELLTPDIGGTFETLRSTFAPGAELAEAQQRDTEEAGYMLEGILDLWIGETCHRLHPGDSFRFKGEPYRWHNPGPVDAVAIWTIAPPVY